MTQEYFNYSAMNRAIGYIRCLDKRARAFYEETYPLEVYELNGLFYVRGCFEFDNLTLSELEETFCGLYEACNN